jgi:hypothetical protein
MFKTVIVISIYYRHKPVDLIAASFQHRCYVIASVTRKVLEFHTEYLRFAITEIENLEIHGCQIQNEYVVYFCF